MSDTSNWFAEGKIRNPKERAHGYTGEIFVPQVADQPVDENQQENTE